MDAYGIDASAANDENDTDDEDVFLVMPDNWLSVRVFLSLQRCWRMDSFNGRYFGFDRPSIESTLHLMQIKRKRHLSIFEDLCVMETAALEILNAAKDDGQAR